MNPCTRRTLFRLVLAIRLYGAGLSWMGRYAIPRKFKVDVTPLGIYVRRQALRILAHTVRPLIFPRGGLKIGDTIAVRKPGRYL